MKIALIRLDKIGDLVSTLPVDQVPELAGHEVHWIISKGLEFIPEQALPRRRVHSIPISSYTLGSSALKKCLKEINPDLAVIFHGPWWASYELFKSNVPRRFGRKSQWHSFLFLNDGLRQSRSQSTMHEADYNLQLLNAALGKREHDKSPALSVAPVLKLQAPLSRHLFEKFDLVKNNYYVVHPGMAGSALNWPISHYTALIHELKSQHQVAITGTAADAQMIDPLKTTFAEDSRVQFLQGELSSSDLLFILKNAKAVVVPSTGVAHLAASLGSEVVSLFPPIPSQSPVRWGPRGERVHFEMPQVSCPAKISCFKNRCEHHPCMRLITPALVLARIPK